MWYSVVSTLMGWVGILASPRGLRRLTIPCGSRGLAYIKLLSNRDLIIPEPSFGRLSDIERRIKRYLSGHRTLFPDTLDLIGTPFQMKAWELVRRIPWGETRSYTWVASSIGHPKAARAVGQAMRANPAPLLVPCHRVIGKDGKLCGYGGPYGLGLKSKIIEIELGDHN